jgi:phage gp36-like protein
MGKYITSTQLIDRMTLTKITELCSEAGQPMSEVLLNKYLNEVIRLSEGKVEMYSGRIYKTPLPMHPEVQEWALIFAEYILYKRAPADDVPAKIKTNLDQVLKELNDFCEGKIVITGAIELRKSVGLSLVVQSDSPIFTEKEFFVPRTAYFGGIWT